MIHSQKQVSLRLVFNFLTAPLCSSNFHSSITFFHFFLFFLHSTLLNWPHFSITPFFPLFLCTFTIVWEIDANQSDWVSGLIRGDIVFCHLALSTRSQEPLT